MINTLHKIFNMSLPISSKEDFPIDPHDAVGKHILARANTDWGSSLICCVTSFQTYLTSYCGSKHSDDTQLIKELENLDFIIKPTFDEYGFILKTGFENGETPITMLHSQYLAKIFTHKKNISYIQYYCKNVGTENVYNEYVKQLNVHNNQISLDNDNFLNNFFLGIRFGDESKKEAGKIDYEIPFKSRISTLSQGLYYSNSGMDKKIGSIVGWEKINSQEGLYEKKRVLEQYLIAKNFIFINEENISPDTICFNFINEALKIASKIMILKNYKEIYIYAHHKDYSHEYQIILNKKN